LLIKCIVRRDNTPLSWRAPPPRWSINLFTLPPNSHQAFLFKRRADEHLPF
jgi:hypothetical protein